ncbi:MAG: SDR family NAD(P)-dependent oxidoreductase, partial [Burkholderiales bacterium]
MKLRNKVSIITGAGRGIGHATALKFAREGAKVVVCDINQEWVKETVEEIQASGGEAIGCKVDVTDKK